MGCTITDQDGAAPNAVRCYGRPAPRSAAGARRDSVADRADDHQRGVPPAAPARPDTGGDDAEEEHDCDCRPGVLSNEGGDRGEVQGDGHHGLRRFGTRAVRRRVLRSRSVGGSASGHDGVRAPEALQ